MLDHNSRIFITGSADGLGYAAAKMLLEDGHEVVVHVRSSARRPAVQPLVDRGAVVVVGDLADSAQTRDLAAQVTAIGPMDAVIHNAAIVSGSSLLMVNVTAPYLLTALIPRPKRLIYLSSGDMHASRRTNLDGLDWSGRTSSCSYADSKLFITTLAMAIARRWPDVFSNAVDPGWVATKMGGASAPDDLQLGHVTQTWLAVSNALEALTSGGYWYHQRRVKPQHPAVYDTAFQDRLLTELARITETPLL